MKQYHHWLCLFGTVAAICFFPAGVYAETTSTELHIMASRSFDVMDRYAKETQVSIIINEFKDSMMEEIANSFVTRNDDVDIYLFDAQDGLYYLKEKGYYYPLNASTQLMTAYANLYPAFQKALTSNGDLVAWVMYAQPFVRMEASDVLAVNGLKSPTTFLDFLDTCRDLLVADALGDEYSLIDIFSYKQQDMMDFYMKQYIMSSQAQYGAVNFSGNHFAQTAERIKNNLPITEPTDLGSEQETLPTPIFCLMTGYETVTDSMMPMPTVLDNAPTAIETYMTVAVINPASPRKEQAIRFLEYCSKQIEPDTFFYNASCVEPMENPTVVAQIVSLTEKMKALETQTEPLTPAQRNDLAMQKNNLHELEKNRYLVTPEAIKCYANMAKSLYIAQESPITYDDALQGMVSQYLHGIVDLQTFIENCQKHVDLIERESTVQCQ